MTQKLNPKSSEPTKFKSFRLDEDSHRMLEEMTSNSDSGFRSKATLNRHIIVKEYNKFKKKMKNNKK